MLYVRHNSYLLAYFLEFSEKFCAFVFYIREFIRLCKKEKNGGAQFKANLAVIFSTSFDQDRSRRLAQVAEAQASAHMFSGRIYLSTRAISHRQKSSHLWPVTMETSGNVVVTHVWINYLKFETLCWFMTKMNFMALISM